MRFEHVHLEALGHDLPQEVHSSAAIETRLAPLYQKLRLSPGRLELMSGIRERRFFPAGTRPSATAARAGAMALERAGIERERVGCVVHAAVSRDFVEPATASVVHRTLELGERCEAFDLSNACLGFANALVLAAERIERGSIEAALVVAGEDGRPLVEETLRRLLEGGGASRAELKRAFASLTIGAGAAAALLVHSSLARSPWRLACAVARTDSHAVELCQGSHAAGGTGLWMETDSEALLQAGNALAARTFEDFLAESGWRREDIEHVVTHQVGSAHRRLLFETLDLPLERDHPTFEQLGNVGSVSLPLSLSLALDAGRIRPGARTALLGIGSGLACQMLALGA